MLLPTLRFQMVALHQPVGVISMSDHPRSLRLLATGAIVLGIFLFLSAVFVLRSLVSLFGLALFLFGVLYVAAGVSLGKGSDLAWPLSFLASFAIIPLALLSIILAGVDLLGAVILLSGLATASAIFLVLVLLIRHFQRANQVAA